MFWDNQVTRLFNLPLSAQASDQLVEIQTILEEREWEIDFEDSWKYSWNSQNYSTKKAYALPQGQIEASPLCSWL